MVNKKLKTIDSVLKRSNVQLDDLLDLDCVISKARANDSQLMHYLRRPEILHQLLFKLTKTYDRQEKSLRYYFLLLFDVI